MNNLANRLWTPLARNRLAPLLEPVILNTVSGITQTLGYWASDVTMSGNTIYITGEYDLPTTNGTTVTVESEGLCYNTSASKAVYDSTTGITTVTLTNPVASRGVLVNDLVTFIQYTPPTMEGPDGIQVSLDSIYAFNDVDFTVSFLATRYVQNVKGFNPVGISSKYVNDLMDQLNIGLSGYTFSNGSAVTGNTQTSVITYSVKASTANALNPNDTLDSDMSFVKSGVTRAGTNYMKIVSGKITQAYQALPGYKF